MHPYRKPTPPGSSPGAPAPVRDREAVWVLLWALVWSLPPVVFVLVRHETFDGDATIALLVAGVSLGLLGGALATHLRGDRRRAAQQPPGSTPDRRTIDEEER